MNIKKEIYLVPYSHLDTQWRWEYPTTIKKYIKKTLEENIYLFEKYPGHRFNFTGALRYSMMKEYYPEQFEKIKSYIDEGRWHLAGTCLDETDALVPSVESMIRNILYGDRWAQNEFGTSSRDYMIPDCFGFPANMPSVLAHCGIHGFSSQKLTWNSAVGIPFELGIWKGPDDNGIVSALNPCAYASRVFPQIQWNPWRLKRLNTLGNKNNIWKSFQYYGVGDVGGAPTEGSVKRVLSSIEYAEKKGTELVVRQGSADQFFSEITEEEKSRMDSYAGDLLLINHSAGTLTSATIMKRWNRKNEQLAFAAEVAAISALVATGAPYPQEKIKSAWYRMIGNQMHDILPGTSTPTAYEYSQNDEVIALSTWISILQDSATAIASIMKGDGEILLFNPLGENRRDVVELLLPQWDDKKEDKAVIMGVNGKSIPVQIHKNQEGKYKAIFIPDLDPFSWSRYSISQSAEEQNDNITNPVSMKHEDNCYIMENSNYKVTITENGEINSIYHKILKKELLKTPIAYEFQKERPKLYPSWNMDWNDRKKDPFLRLESGGEVCVIENGPLRCTIQVTMMYNTSKFVKLISLSHESKIVEFTEKISWRELGCSLKLALSTNMNKPEITYNWETSRIERGLNNEKLFEMPSRMWVDMKEEDWGISIIEDSKYGYDHPRDDTLRMTLLYTPGIRYTNGFWDQKYHDWGEHTIRYGIYAHEGDFKTTDHLARRFNQPIRSFAIEGTESFEGKEISSLFEVSTEQMGILATKKPEDTDGILIRFYERYGKALNAEISFSSQLLDIKEVNGLEEPIGSIKVEGNKFKVDIGANGIRSYIVKLKDLPNYTQIKQEASKLEYNHKLIGKNGEKQGLYPIELTPPEVKAGNISFHLAIDEELNSLQCKGQKIPISEDYNTISLLVAAEEDCNASFTWLDTKDDAIKEKNYHISSMTGFHGQWDTRIWKRKPKHHLKNRRDYVWINKCIGVKPGFINRDRLEWYSTHIHKDGQDQAYQYGYMYTLTLDIPQGAKSLDLPDNPDIHILAMTTSQQPIKVHNSHILNDKYDF
jgi:alpha-mannosidase